jgi:alpha-glucosidase
VPTWWDETRVVDARIGELLVTARRKGATWYLGGISARQSRELSLPLSFLSQGRYTAKVWKDASDTDSDPNHLATQTLTVTPADQLKVRVALDGGFVAQFVPAEENR